MRRYIHMWGVTLFLAGGIFVSFPSFALAVDCVGATSGNVGECNTVARCSGNVENATESVCKDEQICCVQSDATPPGTKPPKTPPVIIDPVTPGPGENPGTGNCGGGNGTCVSTANECSGSTAPDAACSGVCCLGLVGAPVNECANVGGRCATLSGGCAANETSSTRSCNDSARICCMPSTTGQSECAAAGGSCRTVGFGCMPTETSSPLTCGSGHVCCRSSSTGGTGTTTTGTGAVTTGACPANYQKVAGVCFPQKSVTGLSDKSVLEIITALLGWLLAIFGFIALIGFVISGMQYLLSTGDEGMAETAKRNMKYSVIGIIVALSGWIIIKAVDALLNANSFI